MSSAGSSVFSPPSSPGRPSAADRLAGARRLVEAELRRVAVGERLPAMRVLRERSRVGLAQLRQVMETLEAEGVVERRPRSGLYKAGAPQGAAAVHTLDLVACGRLIDIGLQSEQFYTGDLIRTFAAEAGRRGLAIRLRQVFAWESVARYEEIAADPAVAGCLLFSPHLPELAAIFERRGVKTVSLVPQQPQADGPVIIDGLEMVRLQLEHLWALGHQRIAYMDPVDPIQPSVIALQRREQFYRLMGQRGLPVQDQWVFHVLADEAGFDSEQVGTILKEVFATDPAPTAVICSDAFAPHLYHFADTRNWRIGRELSVVGTDDMPIAAMLYPPLTTVRNDRVQMAQLAMVSLERLLAGEDVPQCQQVPLKLVVRQSTGPV